jgi:hypothetical protein
VSIALLSAFSVAGQSQPVSSLVKGHFSGSYESYSQVYLKDTSIGATLPPDQIGSNNFLKLDYNYGRFSAGIQYESYLPAIQGFFAIDQPAGSKLINKYFRYDGEKFSLQLGDFYEQFGSGLVFRAFENRQIGINNAMEGVNIYVEPTDFLKLKVLYGKPRRFFTYEDAVIRGADAELDLNAMMGKKNAAISAILAGSYVGKYQIYTGPIDNFPTTVNAFSGRLNLSHSDFSLDAEYVTKGADPGKLNNNNFDNGSAFQLDGSFTKNNFGASATYRTLYNMGFQADRTEEFVTLAPVNYVPALTKQLDYLTSNIYVYAAQFRGESGFQSDVFYNFSPGSAIGGKHGLKLAANFSRYTQLNTDNALFSSGETKLFNDANLEIKKKWSKKLETTLAFQNLYYNATVIRNASDHEVHANMIAAGFLYKWASHKSLRMKLENLMTSDDLGGWAAALAEVSFSSPVMFFASDLYNYGKTDLHYYNVGASMTKKATRFSLSFGKQRAGLFCVGGVCRFVPASYGFTASLTTSFSN